MKIAVINLSGNVGKTTLVKYLLKPQLKDAKIFSIESVNQGADGKDVEKLKGKQFGSLVDELLTLDSAIVDVGASNVEDFLKLMQQYDGSHEDFDYFIVPVVKEKKAQADTINTLSTLNALGVPSHKIKLVFNKVEIDDDVTDEFSGLFGFQQIQNIFTINPEAVIYLNEFYERLSSTGITLTEITSDETNYRAELKKAKAKKERVAVEEQRLIDMISIKRLSVSANKNLERVYSVLFKNG